MMPDHVHDPITSASPVDGPRWTISSYSETAALMREIDDSITQFDLAIREAKAKVREMMTLRNDAIEQLRGLARGQQALPFWHHAADSVHHSPDQE